MTLSAHAKVYHGIDILQNSSLDEGNVTFHAAVDLTPKDFPNGTSAGQVSKAFTDSRTIASLGTDSLDLAGSLTDALGATLTFTVVKAIEIVADAANAHNIEVGGAGTNGFKGPFKNISDIIVLSPGDVMLVTSHAGWTVTAATGDILQIANTGTGAVVYTIRIVG